MDISKKLDIINNSGSNYNYLKIIDKLKKVNYYEQEKKLYCSNIESNYINYAIKFKSNTDIASLTIIDKKLKFNIL